MNKIDLAFELINIFHDNNHESYLVGGSVRNYIMNIPIKDIDMITNATPSQMITLAKNNNLKYIETGIKHGTITIIFNELPIEVTTFRVDKDCDGRHCNVEFVKTLKEDLSRRDFTVNAIAMDRNYNIIDLFNGIKDIQDKVIKAVGDPTQRFEEDKLRALRALRFATTLKFYIENETYDAIKKVNLDSISKERIRDELSKILLSSNRIYGIEQLQITGLLSRILPEVSILEGVLQDEINHPEKDVFIHTMLALDSLSTINDEDEISLELVLATLLHDVGKPLTRSFESETEIHFYEHEEVGAEIAEAVLTRLKFPRFTIDKVKWLVSNHMRIHQFNEMKKSKKVKFIENEYFLDLVRLAIADIKGSSALYGNTENFKTIYDIENFITSFHEEMKNRPVLKQKLINGYDVMNLGVSSKEGIKIGQILEKVNDAVIEGIINSREEALDFVRGMI